MKLNYLALIAGVHAWGGDLHREITSRALDRISDSVTQTFIAEILGSRAMVIESSTWADSEEARTTYPGSEDQHFSHTPWRNCQPFVMDRDCDGGNCIVTGIAEHVLTVIDNRKSMETRRDALKFVIHLMADIHQPLHTGFSDDMGGVTIKLAGFEHQLSLHQMWDFGMMDGWALPKPVITPSVRLTKILANVKVPAKIESYDSVIELASAIASESTRSLTCQVAYQDESGNFIRSHCTLSERYMETRRSVIVDRVDLAAIRLARLLHSMARSAVNSGSRSPIRPPVAVERSANRFATLAIDFDPEDYLVDMGESPASPARRRARRVHKDRMDGIDSLKSTSPTPIRGWNITDFLLVKFNEKYYITCPDRADSKYREQGLVVLYRVKFSQNRDLVEPFVFILDAECFPDFASEDVLRVLLYLRGIPESDMAGLLKSVNGQAVSVRMVTESVFGFAPLEGEWIVPCNKTKDSLQRKRAWSKARIDSPISSSLLAVYEESLEYHDTWDQINITGARSFRDLENHWDLEFASKLSEIVVFAQWPIEAVFLKSTLTSGSDWIRMTVIPCYATNYGSFMVLFDTAIVYGDMTTRITQMLAGIHKRARENPAPMEAILRARPTLQKEIEDLVLLFTGKEADRWKKFTAIDAFSLIPSTIAEKNAVLTYGRMKQRFIPISHLLQ